MSQTKKNLIGTIIKSGFSNFAQKNAKNAQNMDFLTSSRQTANNINGYRNTGINNKNGFGYIDPQICTIGGGGSICGA